MADKRRQEQNRPNADQVGNNAPSDNLGQAETHDDAAGAPSDRPELRRAWQVVLGVGIAAALFIIIYGGLGGAWQAAFLELAIAACAVCVGSLLGFLFGIPRSGMPVELNADEPPGDNAGRGDRLPEMSQRTAALPAPRSARFQPSTNLEQVSDWLTKILIGAGLVQLSALRNSLAATGDLVESSFPENSAGLGVLTQVVIVTFAVIGFLTAYLWTRIHYGRIQIQADVSANELLSGLRNVARQTKKIQEDTSRIQQETEQFKAEQLSTERTMSLLLRGALEQPSQTAPRKASVAATEPLTEQREFPPDVQTKIQQMRHAELDWDSDPTLEILGKQPAAANGRRLEASIVTNLRDGLTLSLQVVSTEGRPLVGDVAFFLHPTYPDPVIIQRAEGNKAEVAIYANAGFTVGAIADSGDTILTLDLCELPGAPSWFTK